MTTQTPVSEPLRSAPAGRRPRAESAYPKVLMARLTAIIQNIELEPPSHLLQALREDSGWGRSILNKVIEVVLQPVLIENGFRSDLISESELPLAAPPKDNENPGVFVALGKICAFVDGLSDAAQLELNHAIVDQITLEFSRINKQKTVIADLLARPDTSREMRTKELRDQVLQSKIARFDVTAVAKYPELVERAFADVRHAHSIGHMTLMSEGIALIGNEMRDWVAILWRGVSGMRYAELKERGAPLEILRKCLLQCTRVRAVHLRPKNSSKFGIPSAPHIALKGPLPHDTEPAGALTLDDGLASTWTALLALVHQDPSDKDIKLELRVLANIEDQSLQLDPLGLKKRVCALLGSCTAGKERLGCERCGPRWILPDVARQLGETLVRGRAAPRSTRKGGANGR